MGIYTAPIKIWRKNISSDKTWVGFNKLFAEEYHDLCELQCINAAQAGFHRSNMAITMQDRISEAL